jgi:aspartate racemase
MSFIVGTILFLKGVFNDIFKKSRYWLRWCSVPYHRPLDLTLEEQKTLLARFMLERSNKLETFIASFSQEGLWYLNWLEPTNSAYNLQVGWRLRGPLHRNALELSLQEIVNRHDMLRTEFALDVAQLTQVIVPYYTVDLPLTDLSHLQESSRYAAAYELAVRETQVIFDLAHIPLLRCRLIRLAPDDHILLCIMHHIVSDGWSLRLFAQELTVLYSAFSVGRVAPLAPLSIQYGDYAQWQRAWLTGELLDSQIDYWRRKLRGAPPLLELPTAHVRPPRQDFDGASQTLSLPKDLVRDLTSLATQQDATLFMITLATFKVLLSRYSRQEDILIGVPVAGRNRVETEALIGFFVNMMVLRTDLSGNPRFCDLLAQVREVALEAFCNSDIPFVKLVEELQPVRSLSYNPIFQVAFAVIKSAVQADHFGALHASPYVVTSSTSPFDLTMNLIECANAHWVAQLEYNTTLVAHEYITRMLGHYIALLYAVVAEPHVHIADLLRLIVSE